MSAAVKVNPKKIGPFGNKSAPSKSLSACTAIAATGPYKYATIATANSDNPNRSVVVLRDANRASTTSTAIIIPQTTNRTNCPRGVVFVFDIKILLIRVAE
jgi:hypothetical protein